MGKKFTQIYVLDNSVVLKPFFDEDGAKIVSKIFFLKENYKISIFLPEIFRFEFFNTVLLKKSEEIAFQAFTSFIDKQVTFVPFESDLVQKASNLVKKYPRVSFYDASYHALAKAYEGIFITADKKYYEQTKKEGNIELLENLHFDFIF